WYLEHRFFPSFGSSLHTTYWKAKFRGKLTATNRRATLGDQERPSAGNAVQPKNRSETARTETVIVRLSAVT
ncbi:hypothetical protein, partial [Paraburkholderia nemoris]|uniref:hypothetical protein n=1 Tax=Paraburkholderia nemoris TaxID=2793076 RepID=UPI001B8D18A7